MMRSDVPGKHESGVGSLKIVKISGVRSSGLTVIRKIL